MIDNSFFFLQARRFESVWLSKTDGISFTHVSISTESYINIKSLCYHSTQWATYFFIAGFWSMNYDYFENDGVALN